MSGTAQANFAVFVLDIVDVISRARLPLLLLLVLIVRDYMTRALEHISQAAAYSLLFTPSARHLMSRKDETNEKLGEVFE